MNTTSLFASQDDPIIANMFQAYAKALGITDPNGEANLRQRVAQYCEQCFRPVNSTAEWDESGNGPNQESDGEILALALIGQKTIYLVHILAIVDGQCQVTVKKYSTSKDEPKQYFFVQRNSENNYQLLYQKRRHTNRDAKQFLFSTTDRLALKGLENYIHQCLGDRNFRLDHIQAFLIDDLTSDENQTISEPVAENVVVSENLDGVIMLDSSNEFSSYFAELGSDHSAPASQRQDELMAVNGTGLSAIETQFSGTTSISDVATERRKAMRLLIKLMEKFRGRTAHEYKPLRAFNRNGVATMARPPTYVADRFGNHYLDLLIPEIYLTDRNKTYYIVIYIITVDIDGRSYVHPYFKFQQDPIDRSIPDVNPLMILVDLNDVEFLTIVLDNYFRLRLYLVLLVLTNAELIQNAQRLQIFSADGNGQLCEHSCRGHDDLKSTYRLHELRFAFSLWEKTLDSEEFVHIESADFISESMTENRRHVNSRK